MLLKHIHIYLLRVVITVLLVYVIVITNELHAAEVELVIPNMYCSCVKTARNEGINIPYNTDAIEIIPNSTPTINGLIILKYNDINNPGKIVYHIVVIKAFTDTGFLIVEGNKEKCERTIRIIAYNDIHLVGFWKSI